MKNCIVRTYMDDTDFYWTGIGWVTRRDMAGRYSLPEAENLIDNMRHDDVMAYWERYDKKRSSL